MRERQQREYDDMREATKEQRELIIDILESAIDPKLYDLLDDTTPKDIAASETAPKGKEI